MFVVVARAFKGALPSPMQGGLSLARLPIFSPVVGLVGMVIAAVVVGALGEIKFPTVFAHHRMIAGGWT
jgi:hypothetical protein